MKISLLLPFAHPFINQGLVATHNRGIVSYDVAFRETDPFYPVSSSTTSPIPENQTISYTTCFVQPTPTSSSATSSSFSSSLDLFVGKTYMRGARSTLFYLLVPY